MRECVCDRVFVWYFVFVCICECLCMSVYDLCVVFVVIGCFCVWLGVVL